MELFRMERFAFRAGMILVGALIALQGFIFYNEYESVEYAPDKGSLMEENTYLYAYDELTIWIEGDGELENLVMYKNGDAVVRNFYEPYTLKVRENDLLEISADKSENTTLEIHMELKDKVFDNGCYVDVFDYSGGRVTVARFINNI